MQAPSRCFSIFLPSTGCLEVLVSVMLNQYTQANSDSTLLYLVSCLRREKKENKAVWVSILVCNAYGKSRAFAAELMLTDHEAGATTTDIRCLIVHPRMKYTHTHTR